MSDFFEKIYDSDHYRKGYSFNFGRLTGDQGFVRLKDYNTLVDRLNEYVNGGSSGAGVISKTYAELAALKTAGTLTPGAMYHITDRDYFIIALSNSILSEDGWRIMEIVPYTYYQAQPGYLGVWNSDLSPGLDSKVIWGGRLWTNISGNLGSEIDDQTLSGSDWTQDSTGYELRVFGITYNFNEDWVSLQWDSYNNRLGTAEVKTSNPVDYSDWGLANSNTVGMFNNRAEGIYNNACFSINNNVVYGTIDNNVDVEITKNHLTINNGNISKNKVGAIYWNTCGKIRFNTNCTIFRNSCTGDISSNNAVNINHNSNMGSILANTVQIIEYNSNLGLIQNNLDPIRHISYNRNSGNIIGNTAIGSYDITYNTNNGYITKTNITANVSDTIVNKT